MYRNGYSLGPRILQGYSHSISTDEDPTEAQIQRCLLFFNQWALKVSDTDRVEYLLISSFVDNRVGTPPSWRRCPCSFHCFHHHGGRTITALLTRVSGTRKINQRKFSKFAQCMAFTLFLHFSYSGTLWNAPATIENETPYSTCQKTQTINCPRPARPSRNV